MTPMHLSTLSATRSGRGFSLLEVLIALLVFSVGLLGIGGLQLLSKQTNFEAIQRTTASMLVYDIIERMRANPRALGDYTSYTGSITVGGGILIGPATDCETSECTAAELAAYDLRQWEQAIDGATETSADGDNAGGVLLPTGCITGPADGSAGTYTISLAWQGKAALSDAAKSDNRCGTGRYGANDEYRRLLSITTYIANE